MATSSTHSRSMATEIQSDLIPHSGLISRVEVGLLLVVFGVLWAALNWFAKGGPVSTDVLYYFQLGQLRIADPFVLNRYFHIYLQKIFVDTASTPLLGMQSFWACLLALTTVGVYLLGRLATRHSTPMHGVFAVALFVSLPSLPITAGVPYVDLTLTVLSLLVLILYLISVRQDHRSWWLLLGLGFVGLLGFKTKEIFIATAIVLIGIFWEKNRFDFRIGLQRLFPMLIGVLLGAVFLQLCHWLVLGQPLFGLRVEDYQIFNETYATAYLSLSINTAHANLYSHFIYPFFAAPFLLFLLSIDKTARMQFANKLIWLVPVIFLAMESNFLKFYVEQDHRSFLPFIPVICALAPQFISLTDDQQRRSVFKIQAVHIGVAVLGAMLMFGLKNLIISAGNDSSLYLDVIILPITLTLIFIVQIGLTRGLPKSLLLAALLFALIMPAIQNNLREFLIEQTNFQVFTHAAIPITELGKVVDFKSDPIIAIEHKAVLTDSLAFNKDVNEVSALFNLTNDTYTNKNDFRLLTEDAQVQAVLNCQEEYSYVLLSSESWIQANTPRCIVNTYEIDQQSISNKVLLIRK